MTFIHFILCFMVAMCGINVVYEAFKFGEAMYSFSEFKTTTTRRVLLCASLAYIITIIFIGFPV